MKYYSIFLLFILSVISSNAQHISINDFQLAKSDQTANTVGTMEKDQNGEIAALIKVKTDKTGFTFDGGALGIVKTSQKNGEIWVYIPRGSKKITIKHPLLGVLRDYYYPTSILAGNTYNMILTTSKVETIGSDGSTSKYGEANISSKPAMADLFIDGEPSGQTPLLISELPVGKHEILISKFGYFDYKGTLTVKAGETSSLTANLKVNPDERLEADTMPKDLNRTITVGEEHFVMVFVEGGNYKMGGDKSQKDLSEYEKYIHDVTVPSFYIGETEVTQELWTAVMGGNPSHFKGKNLPLENATWDDCQEFIAILNQKTGMKFRLPEEEEWEFAARGGNKSKGYIYSGSNNIDEVAWYKGNSGKFTTHEVKTKKPNELGIYDMSGNVEEFCQNDCFTNYKKEWSNDNPNKPFFPTIRNGNFNSEAKRCRNSFRSGVSTDFASPLYGLRLVLSK